MPVRSLRWIDRQSVAHLPVGIKHLCHQTLRCEQYSCMACQKPCFLPKNNDSATVKTAGFCLTRALAAPGPAWFNAGMNSRDKGKRGEREAARVLREVFGCEFRRSQQYAGGVDSADVVGGPADLHWEVKHQERMRLYDWIDQAVADSGERTPLVLHRQNRKEWLVTLRVNDLVALGRILGRWDTRKNSIGSCS
jgi:Holliday junction resolvase